MDSDVSSADQSASAPSGTQFSDTVCLDGASEVEVSRQSEAALPGSEVEELDTYNLIEPPPLDWRSDSSSEVDSADDSSCHCSVDDLEKPSPGESVLLPLDTSDTLTQLNINQQELMRNNAGPLQEVEVEVQEDNVVPNKEKRERVEDMGAHGENQDDATFRDYATEEEVANRGSGDEDHSRIHSLLSQLQLMGEERRPKYQTPPPYHCTSLSELEECASSQIKDNSTETTGLLFSENHQRDLLGLLQCTEIGATPHPTCLAHRGEVDAVVSVSYSQEDAQRFWGHHGNGHLPGPCDPEDLLDGVIFGAKYLGSTQIKSEKNPSTNARMAQAQEAVDRIKAPEGESQPMTEVDLFISTQRVKVLTADTQEAMMDHALQMISYIADIGDIVVLMARRKRKGQDDDSPTNSSSSSSRPQKKCLMICHVFSSEDAQIIAQAIGQAFGVAYQQFLQTNGIKASDLRPGEYSDYLENQELYNGDLAHFSDSQNLRDVVITKSAGEILGLAVVESGWGSILPTVVVANLLHGGPAERCGELSIGDRIMSVNGTSLVGLPITTCQNIIRDLKNQKYVKLSIVHCPPVTMAIIKRPDPKFQLGFSVEDGIICSLMRGGIAERGGIRVGHRIIEINGQSVVATPHDKIIQILTNAVGEIHLKTMPASTYRLLTGQEQPVFL
uniref:Amyloid-beta A4 precursor protein-binding family A member 3 n=1 Tax=Mastacembelus armatus TaxID=205130 RepID=A0A3Q3KXG4_9TELE